MASALGNDSMALLNRSIAISNTGYEEAPPTTTIRGEAENRNAMAISNPEIDPKTGSGTGYLGAAYEDESSATSKKDPSQPPSQSSGGMDWSNTNMSRMTPPNQLDGKTGFGTWGKEGSFYANLAGQILNWAGIGSERLGMSSNVSQGLGTAGKIVGTAGAALGLASNVYDISKNGANWKNTSQTGLQTATLANNAYKGITGATATTLGQYLPVAGAAVGGAIGLDQMATAANNNDPEGKRAGFSTMANSVASAVVPFYALGTAVGQGTGMLAKATNAQKPQSTFVGTVDPLGMLSGYYPESQQARDLAKGGWIDDTGKWMDSTHMAGEEWVGKGVQQRDAALRDIGVSQPALDLMPVPTPFGPVPSKLLTNPFQDKPNEYDGWTQQQKDDYWTRQGIETHRDPNTLSEGEIANKMLNSGYVWKNGTWVYNTGGMQSDANRPLRSGSGGFTG